MKARGRRWTFRDDAALRLLWGLPLAEVCRELDRTPAALYSRATCLGLRHGVPPEGEHPNQAAARTGYDPPTLDNVLRWAKARGVVVEAHRRLALSSRRRWYEPEQVDAAVALWARSETVVVAARRLGLAGTTLRRWMCEAGHEPPPRKRPWRMLPEEFDGVVRARRAS